MAFTRALIGIAAFLLSSTAFAHPERLTTREVLGFWTWDPLMTAVLGVLATTYAVGLTRLWKSAGKGHGIKRWEAAAYFGGVFSVAVALFSPIDRLSDFFFSAHMTQHEILMVLAAPLIVLGRPLFAAIWALPQAVRDRVGKVVQTPVVAGTWRGITGPFVVLVLHAAVLWIWHVPALFEAALANEKIHAVQHATFFGTAALFFWALVHGRYGKTGYGVAVLYVFATAMHTSVLGALLTVARGVWYPTYAIRAPEAGVPALDDQALAGLVMWIPAGVIFVVVALALFSAWLGEAARKVARNEALRGGAR